MKQFSLCFLLFQLYETANKYHFLHSLALLAVPHCRYPMMVSTENQELIDQMLIHQKLELIEGFIGFEGNKYEVRNSLGQHVFHAEEQNDCCTRNCCGSLRRFSMRLDDPTGREVLRMVRPLKCVSCWFPCCLQELHMGDVLLQQMLSIRPGGISSFAAFDDDTNRLSSPSILTSPGGYN
ncbi:hypothetical protein JD844_000787 [Phrynosoma platyrhinos]|uniref:Phospholipid scramblase n=1 Tax=Phrynosoma platyrhinos TaxID=52577 RepID=A0ABQ7T8W9_PHRPL|nr:hypothetical protein JD844_000787 [Phrynosoma platyrhinos]